jgi:hypothetical protein
LISSFTAPQTAVFSLSLSPGRSAALLFTDFATSAFVSATNAATALSEDGASSRSFLLLVILLPLVAALIAFAVGFLVSLRTRRNANGSRYAGFNDSDDSPPRTLDFCSDSGRTVNTTLTTTLVDGDDSQWIPPAGSFSASGFGPLF